MRNTQGLSLTYSLVEQIGQAIVAGAYDNADFPTERELGMKHGAGRTATREAVKMLVAKGLLSGRPRQGTALEPQARWNVLDPDVLRWMLERKSTLRHLSQFTEMRLGVEPAAAALAASHATGAGQREIRAAMARLKAADAGFDDPLGAEIALHAAILNATRNPFYVGLQDLVSTALRISIRFASGRQERKVALARHEALVTAILGRQADEAAQLMHAMIVDLLTLIRSAAAERRLSPGGPMPHWRTSFGPEFE
ncbi:FadR family transcriptional regulator [Caulobacter zeae]|uniref:FadR family transcriptional regulator n=1 Tax=Caulobacter zeae TaxID=2055137 RepID=A0A2N5DAF1_9CAUL|nr:FCD domain-containing protein [Caulobacter zeae]PLR23027.1 FadR family transcriptional regulator [Caulobacter zeae]